MKIDLRLNNFIKKVLYTLIQINTSFKRNFTKSWLQLRVIGGAQAYKAFTEMLRLFYFK